MKNKLWTLVFIGLPAMAFATGQGQLEEFLKNAKTAEGAFSQNVVDKTGKTIEADNKGTFRFSRPGNFIWIYEEPYYQSIVSNGKTLWVWDKDMNQVTTRKVAGAIPSSPASILFGSSDLKKEWNIAEGPLEDGLEWVTLTPKKKDGSFEEVKIGLADNLPVKLEFKGNLGETSKLVFSNVKTGTKIPAKTFQFQIPKGADVLKVD